MSNYIDLTLPKEKKVLNVGQFIDNYYPVVDGVVVCVENYTKLLMQKGHCCTVFAPKYPQYKDKAELAYRIVRSRSTRIPVVGYTLANCKNDTKFKKQILASNLNIIHAHSPFAVGKYGLYMAQKLGIPIVATFHSQFKLDFQKFIKADFIVDAMIKYVVDFFEKVDKVWAVTPAAAEILKSYGCTRPIDIMYNGCDYDYPKNVDEKLKLANTSFKLSEQQNVLLFVGRPDSQKNIYAIIESMKILKDSGVDYKLLIVGSSYEDEKVNSLIEDLGLNNNVVMAGKIYDRDKLSALYLRADLLLMPSVYDTASIVKIEGAAHKTPTLLVKDTPAATGVTHNHNGYLVENDSKDFARVISEALKDKDKLKEVSQNAYDTIFISWDKIVNKVEESYNEIIKEYKEKGSFAPKHSRSSKQEKNSF